jgi:hypothetical protein
LGAGCALVVGIDLNQGLRPVALADVDCVHHAGDVSILDLGEAAGKGGVGIYEVLTELKNGVHRVLQTLAGDRFRGKGLSSRFV